jgi:hypothetical protein
MTRPVTCDMLLRLRDFTKGDPSMAGIVFVAALRPQVRPI